MKKIIILLCFCLFLIINIKAQVPGSLRYEDAVPKLSAAFGTGGVQLFTPFIVHYDCTWGLRVRFTNVSNLTGYFSLYHNDVQTGKYVKMPFIVNGSSSDSIAISAANMDFVCEGDYNSLDWWIIGYTGPTNTTGNVSATLTTQLKYRY